MTTQNASRAFKQATGLSIGYAVLMVLLGILGVAVPLATGIGVAILVAWVMVFGGAAHLAYAFEAERAGQVLWRLLVGVGYIACGFYLLVRPGLSLVALTLAMGVVFLAEGVSRIILFFQSRHEPGAGWLFVDGVMTVALAFIIMRSWPVSAAWAIGTLLGVNLLVSGFTRLMIAIAARRAVHVPAYREAHAT